MSQNTSSPTSTLRSGATTLATAEAGAKLAAVPFRLAGGLLAIVQVAFALLAAWDLWQRPADDVRGPKLAWAPALFINWIGPAAYFLFGIRHENR
jgi:type III secretory pathway component EscT